MSDAFDIAHVQRQLMNVATQLEQLAPDVAAARTAKDYDSDRKKAALAENVVPLMDEGMSASAAETKGRISPRFVEQMKALRSDYLTALTVIARHDALMCRFDALRSILAVQRATLGL